MGEKKYTYSEWWHRRATKVEPHVEIKSDGILTRLFINGKDSSELARKVTVVFEAGKPPKLDIDMSIAKINIDGAILPSLPEPWKDYYVEKKPVAYTKNPFVIRYRKIKNALKKDLKLHDD